ncbi:hypothetical protein PHYSODRAFT_336602 [Phytophthora sojae]|uniref:Uncharacterized protein n=1 Tax=Phytophthora sojae (strain P6497) TaxID=1094619 RepID=G4ZYV0_PHYSP|nr:hypothetical protein PHYSODRAFT_336602 [Phytophthora sojae]EGZ12133.1 hypothetical protein PHYSODRAFT_336602 [Phytophthora sojae]|eukprot:XP_009532466.1 hypothetical protein PHYSODRAFT_336602 [Phytophthora sojae]
MVWNLDSVARWRRGLDNDKKRLDQEVQELEAQLADLKERVGLTGDRNLEKAATSNMVLSSVLRQQQLLVANAQAGLSACLFTGAKSLRTVFDAARFYLINEEISISEWLGYITVRDDLSVAAGNFTNCRLSSANENGVKTEVNTASFAQYVDAEQSESNEPFAVLVRDSVDVDEIYPYSPEECVRKDQMGAIVLTALKKKKKKIVGGAGGGKESECGGENEELVVTMRRAGFVKIHRPPFPLPQDTQQGLLQGVMAWCGLMVSNMRGTIDTNS